MADPATTTTVSRWHMLMARRDGFIHNLQTESADRDMIERQLAATEEVLLDEPAPDGAATLVKLELLWEGQLDSDNEDARRKQRILAELRSALSA